MTSEELINKLMDMYNKAPNKEKVTMIHLFGIKYAEEINKCGTAKKEIAKRTTGKKCYDTEIYKGIRLAKYVRLRYKQWF